MDILERVREITTGWYNFAANPVHIQRLSQERLAHCVQCPHMTEKYTIQICMLCGCPLMAKSCNPKSKCDDNRWPQAQLKK